MRPATKSSGAAPAAATAAAFEAATPLSAEEAALLWPVRTDSGTRETLIRRLREIREGAAARAAAARADIKVRAPPR